MNTIKHYLYLIKNHKENTIKHNEPLGCISNTAKSGVIKEIRARFVRINDNQLKIEYY